MGPRHSKTCLLAYTDSKGPYQLVHFQSDLYCPLTETLDTTECMSGEQIPRYVAHVRVNLNLHILQIFEGTFCLMDHICKCKYGIIQTYTLQPLYNTVHYNIVLDITRFKDGSQKCILLY